MRRADLTSKTFGRLTALWQGTRQGSLTTWECICSCGVLHTARTSSLLSGRTTSCGCLTSEKLRAARTTHQQSKKNKTGAYVSWTAMKWRCRTQQLPTSRYYRARNITFCPRWDSFENFFADMGDRPPGLSLDRIDGNLGYSKENCRWATPTEQSRNRRNVKVTNGNF